MAVIGVSPYAMLPAGVELIWTPPLEVVAGQIMAIAGALEATAIPLQAAKQIAQQDMEEKFASETDPDGARWAAWSQSYLRDPRFASRSILTRTGAMRGAARDGYFVRPDTLWWSMTEPFYWIFHELGTQTVIQRAGIIRTSAGRTVTSEYDVYGGGRGKGLPQRRFVSITAGAQVRILAAFERWFDGAITLRRGSSGRITARVSSGLPEGGQFVPL